MLLALQLLSREQEKDSLRYLSVELCFREEACFLADLEKDRRERDELSKVFFEADFKMLFGFFYFDAFDDITESSFTDYNLHSKSLILSYKLLKLFYILLYPLSLFSE